MARKKAYVLETAKGGGRFLDPMNVGSSIEWRFSAKIHETEHEGKTRRHLNTDLDVFVGDCSRTINWTGYGREGMDDMMRKLTNAITELTKAKATLTKMMAAVDKVYEDDDE